MKIERSNTLILLVSDFLKIIFHMKLQYEPSHLNFSYFWITEIINTVGFFVCLFLFPCRQSCNVVNVSLKLFVDKINNLLKSFTMGNFLQPLNHFTTVLYTHLF